MFWQYLAFRGGVQRVVSLPVGLYVQDAPECLEHAHQVHQVNLDDQVLPDDQVLLDAQVHQVEEVVQADPADQASRSDHPVDTVREQRVVDQEMG